MDVQNILLAYPIYAGLIKIGVHGKRKAKVGTVPEGVFFDCVPRTDTRLDEIGKEFRVVIYTGTVSN